MMPDYRSPNLPLLSATVIGWLTSPADHALAPSVAGWSPQAWEGARWAVQGHGIGPLLDCAAARWPDVAALHPRLRQYLADQRRLSRERVALLLRELAEILQACHARNITVMPLKGSLLATTYYAEPGLRPMSDDDLPILGPVPGVDGAFVATGHGAEGLLLGPLSGRLVADAVHGRAVGLDLEPFAPARLA